MFIYQTFVAWTHFSLESPGLSHRPRICLFNFDCFIIESICFMNINKLILTQKELQFLLAFQLIYYYKQSGHGHITNAMKRKQKQSDFARYIATASRRYACYRLSPRP